MAGYREGGVGLAKPLAFKGSGGGVIYLGTAEKPPLEGIGVFPDVMGHSGQSALLLHAKSGGKLGAKLCRPGEVLQDGLLPAVFGNVGQPM